MIFETNERRKAIGIISIHVGDLLIAGSGSFIKYITQRMKEKFEVDRLEENEATYLGMGILKIKMAISRE